MSLASWTLLFGPSGANDDTASVDSSVSVLLPGLGCWQIVRDTRRVKTGSIMSSFFLVHVQHGQEGSGG